MNSSSFNFISINCKVQNKTSHQNHIHFLTHIYRGVSQLGKVVPNGIDKVYTSEFNVWYLRQFLKAPEEILVGIPLEKEVKVEFQGKKFSFIFFDSNHCPGSVMILLKGSFGVYLYTGNCRYSPNLLKHKSLKSSKDCIIDWLYIDGAYHIEDVSFPTRGETVRDAIQIIDAHRNKKVLICSRLLGLENVLHEIALQLNEKIQVTKKKYRVLKKLGWASYFTTEPKNSRISVVDYNQVSISKMKKRNKRWKGNKASIALVLSASFLVWGKDKVEEHRSNGIYLIPYSEHNSSEETRQMVKEVGAANVVYLSRDPTIFGAFGCGQESQSKEVLACVDLVSDVSCSDDGLESVRTNHSRGEEWDLAYSRGSRCEDGKTGCGSTQTSLWNYSAGFINECLQGLTDGE